MAAAIRAGLIGIGIAGGVESMSTNPMVRYHTESDGFTGCMHSLPAMHQYTCCRTVPGDAHCIVLPLCRPFLQPARNWQEPLNPRLEGNQGALDCLLPMGARAAQCTLPSAEGLLLPRPACACQPCCTGAAQLRHRHFRFAMIYRPPTHPPLYRHCGI